MTIKMWLERPEKLTGKGCRSPHYRSIDLPREWPMARLAISNKQINRLVRTFVWRRVTEQALHGFSFVDIPDEINQAYIGDLLRLVKPLLLPCPTSSLL